MGNGPCAPLTPGDAGYEKAQDAVDADAKSPCAYLRKMECPNMQEREGDTSMSYERYDCKVCGAHIALDYEEMR